MIDAAVTWATFPVPTPAGLLLLLLVFHTGPVRRAALATAKQAGIVPSTDDIESEEQPRQKGRDR